MNNATAMIKGLNNALAALTPETAGLMPEFMELNVTLNTVMRKLKEILENVDLSPKEKAEPS